MPKINATAESGNNSHPTASRFEWERALRNAHLGARAYAGLLLATFADGDGTNIYPSQARMAEGFGIDRGKLGINLKFLVKEGWLSCEEEFKDGRKRYRLTIPPRAADAGEATDPVALSDTPCSSELHPLSLSATPPVALSDTPCSSELHPLPQDEGIDEPDTPDPVAQSYTPCSSELHPLSLRATPPVAQSYITSTYTNPYTSPSTSPEADGMDTYSSQDEHPHGEDDVNTIPTKPRTETPDHHAEAEDTNPHSKHLAKVDQFRKRLNKATTTSEVWSLGEWAFDLFQTDPDLWDEWQEVYDRARTPDGYTGQVVTRAKPTRRATSWSDF